MQLVKFWAEWCMPCHKSEPIFKTLAAEFDGRVRFDKVNVDEQQSTAERYSIRAVPTLLVLDDAGSPVADLTSLAFSTTGLRNALENLLSAAA